MEKEQERIEEFEEVNLLDALETCSIYTERISEQIDHILEGFHQNNMLEANSSFGQFIEVIDVFIQMINEIQVVIRSELGEQYKKSENIQNIELHLLSVLQALVPAKEGEDVVILSDLLEFELKENLTKWRTEGIPELIDLIS